VKRVTDIMAEISHASQEQSIGIESVNRAVGEMDEATQQNAALVEQAAGAAASLESEAQTLSSVVSLFKLDNRPVATQAVAPQPARPGVARLPAKTSPRAPVKTPVKPVAGVKRAAAPNVAEEWETF
jgi:methyl-accepting chemotaxis protein